MQAIFLADAHIKWNLIVFLAQAKHRTPQNAPIDRIMEGAMAEKHIPPSKLLIYGEEGKEDEVSPLHLTVH